MVVLAASVITKTGKREDLLSLDALLRLRGCFLALVSRQFVEMPRVRVEGLLAAFPKLVGTGKQHTFVETGNIRYVFQSIEVIGFLSACFSSGDRALP